MTEAELSGVAQRGRYDVVDDEPAAPTAPLPARWVALLAFAQERMAPLSGNLLFSPIVDLASGYARGLVAEDPDAAEAMVIAMVSEVIRLLELTPAQLGLDEASA
jgi:hypothetical protein